MIASAGSSASKSCVFTFIPISIAPSRGPIHPLSTAPSENAFSLASEFHSPFEQIPKQSAPPKRNVTDIASMKPLKFVEVAPTVIATNKRVAIKALRDMIFLYLA